MKKSQLRQFIREEIKKVLTEEHYSETLAKKLVKQKLVNKNMKEKDLFSAIYKQLVNDIGAGRAKTYMRDDDFLAQTLSDIKSYLK